MMYALRLGKYSAMFIRNDGGCTDNKSAAKLFETPEEAHEYVKTWRATSGVNEKETLPLELLEVQTKQVIQKVSKVVEIL
jgi:hypothetical protein